MERATPVVSDFALGCNTAPRQRCVGMNRIRIPKEALIPSVDSAGRLFVHQGRLHRGLFHEHSVFYRDILSGWKHAALLQGGLVHTEPTDLISDDFGLIVEHARIEPETFPYEWTGRTLQRSALFFCEFARRIAAWGIGLKDAHSYNVLFDFNQRPHYIDLGSLVPLGQTQGKIHPEFRRYFLNPLYLMQAGNYRETRHLLNQGGYEIGSKRGGVDDERIIPFLTPEQRSLYVQRRRDEARLRELNKYYDLLLAYEAEIRGLSFAPGESCWATYYTVSAKYPTNRRFDTFEPQRDWEPKQHYLHEFFGSLPPCAILDIGSAAGWFSRLAGRNGHRVISLDCDEAALARLEHHAATDALPIMPLSCEFSRMRQLYPLVGHQHLGRFEADVVLALAIIHHLVFKARMPFSEIVDTLARLTRSTLIVEYMDESDESTRTFRREGDAPWYSVEGLRTELEKHFRRIEIKPSTEGMERFLFVCREKRARPAQHIETTREQQKGTCATVG
jgi:2-polyprenyl-3-methyl-5-hydroxy-6-metoxy-1,4-benzoquinol methylase